MKKFTFKGVLDGFRSSVQAAPRGTEQEIQETLRAEHFQIKKVSAAVRDLGGAFDPSRSSARAYEIVASVPIQCHIPSRVHCAPCCVNDGPLTRLP